MATFFNQSVKNVSDVETQVLTSTSDSTIILSILSANTDGATASDISARRKDASSVDLGYLAFTVTIPADSNVELISNKYILPSGHSINLQSSQSGTIDAQISYVEV
tara:strand:+ start:472 stop:792 length:321 start_codon:yes stop_codon:yes gene_type:complete